MKVFIDVRERDKIDTLKFYYERKKYLFPNIDEIVVKQLEVSDICTEDGKVGIERKSSKDFLQSIFSGRLKKQLYELRQNFEFPFLLIEDYDGPFTCINEHPEMNATALIGTLTSSIAHYRVNTLFVGPLYTQFVFSIIEKFIDGGYERQKLSYTPVRRDTIKKDNQLNILLGVPNISRQRALKLLSSFDYSIKKIVNADIEELKKVEGIGDKIAKEIVNVLQ